MKNINWGRVILGGLLAGVIHNISGYVLNDVVLKNQHEAEMKALGKVMVPAAGSTLMVWLVLGFALGIASVWLYAAIRPRYGAGAMTAVRAGVVVWLLTQVYMGVVMTNLGLFGWHALELVWNFVAVILATVLGAWLYKEEGA